MKRYFYFYDEENRECCGQIIIGTDRDIRSLYKNMKYHGFTPYYVEDPILKPNSLYGIDITEDGFYTVINSETIVRLLLAGVI